MSSKVKIGKNKSEKKQSPIQTVKEKSKQIKLTEEQIEKIIDFIKPNSYIPVATSVQMVDSVKNYFRHYLSQVTIYPELISRLSIELKKMYNNSLVEPGECVGIITAQSIGEKQTQASLSSFHKAGSASSQPSVSKFSELLNATNKPKAPSYHLYLKNGTTDVKTIRETLGNSLVQITFKKITKKFSLCLDKEPEPWYELFFLLYGEKEKKYTDCISLDINMDILYEYRLTFQQIAEHISREYSDMYCVYSPDCFGRIDIFLDTSSIELPEEKLVFVTQDNMREIYLEEVVQPIIENIILCGNPGILNIYFLKITNPANSLSADEKCAKEEWIIETENSRDKASIDRFKNMKEKPSDSTKKFKMVLAHPAVDMTRSLSNNIWDIYYTLGIEAVRQYMIDEFSGIMEGINLCHVMLLVDKMTYSGTISSISRYSMRRDDAGVLQRMSFEETLDNVIRAGLYGQDESTKGVSASIICGKRAQIGTGMCELSVDIKKLETDVDGIN